MIDTRRSRRLATIAMVALATITAVRCVTVWPRLPATMASHFDARGVPNGVQSRTSFVAIVLGSQMLVVFVFAVLPNLLRHVPPRLINLPYREYWMQPGRSEAALDRYGTWSMWFGCATAALVLGVAELAIQANLTQRPMNAALTWLLIGGYLVGTVVAIARLYAVLKPPRA